MALAPADFYAYSQATGIPVPESPQERASLAPQVLNFRRNQLKAPQAEQGGPDPLSLGIGIGLGLAGIGGVAYGAKRFLGGRQRIPKAPTTSANAGTVVQDFDKAGLEKIVNKNVSEAVAEQKRRSAVYQNVAAKPEQDLKPVYKPSADAPVDLITDPNTGEIFARGRSPKSFNELYTSLQTEQTPVESKPSPVNTDIYYEENKPAKSFAEEYISSSPKILSQLRARAAEKIRLQDPVLGDPEWKALINRQTLQEKGELGREAQRQMRVAKQLENEANEFLQQLKQESLSSQAIAAVESGEDQMTGRVMRSVQRNEDLDVSQVNATARQTGSADVAAAATPDGIPFDQAEGIGYDLLTGEKFTLGGPRPTRTGLGPGGTIELEAGAGSDLSQSSAARFLQKRRLELLGDPEAQTSTRLEQKLAEALGPDAWREDPKATRRRNALKLGAAGNEQFFENINEGTFTVGGEQFPISLLKEGVYMEDTAQGLAERVAKHRDWLGSIRLEETNKQIRLGAELEKLNAEDISLMNSIHQAGATLENTFKTPQKQTHNLQLKRNIESALERQDEIDVQINQVLREFELSERRLAGAQNAALRNIRNAAVPQKLMSGVEEGIVVRPVLTAPDNIAFAEGELSNLERGRPVGNFISQEQLEVVPGGLLSGGRAKSIPNIGGDLGIDPVTGERILLSNVDVNTGETLIQKLAGKRAGEDVNVRGRGGVAGLDTKASIGIYGPELASYGTSAMTKEGVYTEAATRPPTATDTSVPVHRIRTYKKGKDNEDIPVYFNYPSSYEDPKAYMYTQKPDLSSVRMSEAVRRGTLTMPKMQGPYESPSALPMASALPEIDNTPRTYSSQLSFPSDVIPATAFAARARKSPADIAAEQLESYMSKLQRGRSTPLTSQAVIQPKLF